MSPRPGDAGPVKRSLLPHVLVTGAGKWVTASITTAAALAALLVNARNLGLEAWLGAHGLGFADYAVARIAVTPRQDSLFAVGDTLVLAATLTNRHGAVLMGQSVTWRSEDRRVAAVDSSGAVVSRGPGVVRVTASVRDLAASAQVVVRPRVTGASIRGDTIVRLPEGEVVSLTAYGLDARGAPVTDRFANWSSSDAAVAAVDSTGTLTAMAPGRAILTATVEGYSAHALVIVVLAPAVVVLESGDAQRVPAGRTLPQPVIVRVLSRGGRPVPSTTVRFAPEDIEAVLAPPEVRTDRAGRARTSWTLSPRPGRQRLLVSVEGLDSVLTLGVEADPVARNTRVELLGRPQEGRVGSRLPEPVAIRVTDSLGAALGYVPVTWRTADGGKVEALADRTDSLGETRAQWTLGPRAGPQRARAQVGNPRTMAPFVVTATGLAGPPVSLHVAAGNAQRGTVGRALAQDPAVRVSDVFDNPVPGVAVRLRWVDGNLSDSSVATDSAGRARFHWTLGRRAGAQRLELRVGGVDSVAVITARAAPLPPDQVEFQNPPATAPPGRAIAMTVVVSDRYGNPLADVSVDFGASGGTLSAARVRTDVRGRAATRWTPGAAGGTQRLTATVRGTTVRATQRVQVGPPPAPEKS